jgi:FKBP-type peptidyl-prolyl cis-trans isomerase (trigger factor)
MGDYETLDALEDHIREDIRQGRERMNDIELGSDTLAKIIENAKKIDWPLGLEEEQIDHEIEHYEYHLKQAGLTLDGALQVQKKSKEELREELRENVVEQLRRGLVMGKLAELEKLEVSQMEVLEQTKLMADMYGGGDRMWQSLLAAEARQSTISNDLLSNKVIRRLAAIAKGEAPEPGAEESTGEAEATIEPATADTEVDSDQVVVDEAAGEAEPGLDSVTPDVEAAADEAAGDVPPDRVESEAEAEDATTEPETTKA